uniref:Uncharacterized protein n=1 Tax=Amphimedon queenslandica TaxID=400682 RepID=A0A1X7VWZ8_AMPQE
MKCTKVCASNKEPSSDASLSHSSIVHKYRGRRGLNASCQLLNKFCFPSSH